MFVPWVSWMLYNVASLQKEYKKDLESTIKGKGMQVGTDTLEIQHAKKASELASEVSRAELETHVLEFNKSH